MGLGPVPATLGWKSHLAPAKDYGDPGGCTGLHPLCSGLWECQDLSLSGTVLPRSSPALGVRDSRIPRTWRACRCQYLSTPSALGFCPNTHLSPGAHLSDHSLCALGLSSPLPGPQSSTRQQGLQALGSLAACRTHLQGVAGAPALCQPPRVWSTPDMQAGSGKHAGTHTCTHTCANMQPHMNTCAHAETHTQDARAHSCAHRAVTFFLWTLSYSCLHTHPPLGPLVVSPQGHIGFLCAPSAPR